MLADDPQYDRLTGLPNLVLFRDRFEQTWLRAQREQTGFALLLLQVDRFDDLIIREVGERLRATLRASDTIARLGLDLFGVIAHGIKDPDTALAVARKVHRAVITTAGRPSVGVALAPAGAPDLDALIRRAELAMGVAQDLGTGTELYTEEGDHARDRGQFVAELRCAIEAREIVCYYQPQATLADGKIESVEAVVRWPHPALGVLDAGEFIPLAVRTGLIHPLTRHALREAIRQCRAWRDDGIELAVWVNIGGAELLDPELPREVADLLTAWQIDPRFLSLEVPEEAILADPTRAGTSLSSLSELGVRLVIDNFGIGRSSLDYLRRLRVDVVKIGKSFVINIESDAANAIIVGSVVRLAHDLGLVVVADGVETKLSLDAVTELGCDLAQGYYIGRPVPPDALVASLPNLVN